MSRLLFSLHIWQNLFSRLSVSPAEITKVKYIFKNLLPNFIKQLALQDIKTVPELSSLCKKLEEINLVTSKRYSEISSLNDSPGPSTSYRNTSHTNSRKTSGSSTSNKNPSNRSEVPPEPSTSKGAKSKLLCYNCNLPNHTFSACEIKRRTFFYRCGHPNVKVSNCPKCSKKTGFCRTCQWPVS